LGGLHHEYFHEKAGPCQVFLVDLPLNGQC
jgi:hypothetical protein